MQLLVTFCDICNPLANVHCRDGRGYRQVGESAAIELGWKRLPDGRIMCPDCQQEAAMMAGSKKNLAFEIAKGLNTGK